jgi:hypothetical protein
MIDMPAAGAARFTADGFPTLLKITEIGVTERIPIAKTFSPRRPKPFAIMKDHR